MPLKIIRQDITKIECEAIVNHSNCYLEVGGGADLEICEKKLVNMKISEHITTFLRNTKMSLKG